MKKIFFLFPLVLLIFSCKKVKDAFDITVPFSFNGNFTLPTPGGPEATIPEKVVIARSPDITNTIPQEFSKNNADINKIKSVSLESVVLTIKSPPAQNFSFLKTIKLYIGATGKPEILLATKDNINMEPPSQTLNLTPAKADLAPYLKGATYYIKTEATIIKNYTADIEIATAIKGSAVANPL